MRRRFLVEGCNYCWLLLIVSFGLDFCGYALILHGIYIEGRLDEDWSSPFGKGIYWVLRQVVGSIVLCIYLGSVDIASGDISGINIVDTDIYVISSTDFR